MKMGNTTDEVCKFLYERMQARDFILLDTETEGLNGGVIDLAIVDADGKTLFDSLIKNGGPIEEGARKVHHITEEMLKDAPSFAEVWPQVRTLLGSVPHVFTYNADFDRARLDYTIKRAGIDWDIEQDGRLSWLCLMQMYAEHWGEESWSGYRWQRLELALFQQEIEHSGYHRALSDAQAAYKLLEHLAGKHEKKIEEEERIQELLDPNRKTEPLTR